MLKMLELGLFYGLIFAFLFYQIYQLRPSKLDAEERKLAERRAED